MKIPSLFEMISDNVIGGWQQSEKKCCVVKDCVGPSKNYAYRRIQRYEYQPCKSTGIWNWYFVGTSRNLIPDFYSIV